MYTLIILEYGQGQFRYLIYHKSFEWAGRGTICIYVFIFLITLMQGRLKKCVIIFIGLLYVEL